MKKSSDSKAARETHPLALVILSGQETGREISLQSERELLLGRLSTADIVVEDDKSSRRHARITVAGGGITLEDLASANGTFLNGQKISRTNLKEGDQIRIGAFQFMVSAQRCVSPEAQEWWEQTGQKADAAKAQPKKAKAPAPLIAGQLKEVSLVELLQLLSNSRKSGMLTIRSDFGVGKIYLVEGQITHAAINDRTAKQPEKTVYRLLRWTSGNFKLEPPDDHLPTVNITENTDALLLEGLQKGDELSGLDGELLPQNAKLALTQPLPGRLRDLLPEELDLCQLVHEHKTLSDILDHHAGSDLEVYTLLTGLLRRKFITTI